MCELLVDEQNGFRNKEILFRPISSNNDIPKIRICLSVVNPHIVYYLVILISFII